MPDTTSKLPVVIDEDQKTINTAEIEVAKKYIITPKYAEWERLFLDKRNKDTFGNATGSALIAYGYDRTDQKQYNVAVNIGFQNVRKCRELRRRYFEEKGFTPGKMYELYQSMMLARKDVDMLYALANDLGIDLPTPVQAPGQASKQQNNQINVNGDMKIEFIKEEKAE